MILPSSKGQFHSGAPALISQLRWAFHLQREVLPPTGMTTALLSRHFKDTDVVNALILPSALCQRCPADFFMQRSDSSMGNRKVGNKDLWSAANPSHASTAKSALGVFPGAAAEYCSCVYSFGSLWSSPLVWNWSKYLMSASIINVVPLNMGLWDTLWRRTSLWFSPSSRWCVLQPRPVPSMPSFRELRETQQLWEA